MGEDRWLKTAWNYKPTVRNKRRKNKETLETAINF
jgi:hypothetical protein